jgi:hypothetical protein
LVAALNSTEHFDKWTNWQYLLHAWNINNPEHEVDIDIPMPDYMNLNNLYNPKEDRKHNSIFEECAH